MDNERKMISFTPAMRDRLRLAYTQARKDGKDQFTFEGNGYVTAYAKYLLEHLDQNLPK